MNTDPKITVYEQINYDGNSTIYTKSTTPLDPSGFSAKTNKPDEDDKHWVVYSKVDFKGSSQILENDTAYPTFDVVGTAKSLKLVSLKAL